MKNKILSLALVAALSLSACAQNGQQNSWGMGNKETIGGIGGAVAGGFLGSTVGKGKGRILAASAGTLLGAMAGSSIGRSLDQADMMFHQQAVEKAYSAPLNQPITWNNPESGHSGTVVPVREGRESASGNLCRQYKQTIVVDGQAQTAYGTACKESDGSWTLKN